MPCPISEPTESQLHLWCLLQNSIEGERIVKTKYGAWYLPKKLWKVRHWDEVSNH